MIEHEGDLYLSDLPPPRGSNCRTGLGGHPAAEAGP